MHATVTRSPRRIAPPRSMACSSACSGCAPRTLAQFAGDLARDVAFGCVLALVPQLLAFGQAEFDFHHPAREVHAQRHDRQALLADAALQFFDLLALEQEFARPV